MPDWRLEVSRRLATLNLAPAREADIVEEVAQHLEDRYRELMAGGTAEADARRMVLEDLSDGDLLAQALRRVEHEAPSNPAVFGSEKGGSFWTGIGEDFRFGLRILKKSPGFAAVAVLTLALGVGANTAIFSLINAVMLRPLPVRNPQSLIVLKWSARQWPKTDTSYGWESCPAIGDNSKNPAPEGCALSYPMFEKMQAQREVFSSVFALFPQGHLGVSVEGNAGFASGEFVSGGFFPAMGFGAALGRLLGPSDDAPAAPSVVVLSYNYWHGQIGGSPTVLGKQIVVNGIPFTIVGVAPRGFSGLDPGVTWNLWLPLSAYARLSPYYPPKPTDAAAWWLMIGARLNPQVKPARAQAVAEAVFRSGVTSGAGATLKSEDSPQLALVSIARGLATMRNGFGHPLFLLLAAVGLVLLIACTNVASLMLARMPARERELAVRLALGANRGRIFRQLLAESLLLAAAGGLLGILPAYLGARSLAEFVALNNSLVEIKVFPDFRVLGFAVAIAVVTGILFGLAPALRSGRIDVAPALKGGRAISSGSPATGGRFRLGNALVVAQVALSILILVGASLLARTLINLHSVNIGFDAHNLVLFSVDPELSGYKREQVISLCRDLRQRLSAIPGVVAVASSGIPLISGSYNGEDFYFAAKPEQPEQAEVLNVGPNFFETLRIPLLFGRTFALEDFQSSPNKRTRVALVNKSFARHFFGKSIPVGRMISRKKGRPPDVEIVGVVGDTKFESLRAEIQPTVYFPQPDSGTFEVRTTLDAKLILPSVREAVRSIDSGLPMYDVMTQTEQIDRTLFQERLVAWLSGAFALLALVVACIGLYGLLSFEVARRTHEMGIRMALGASRAQVLRLVIDRGVRLVALGAVVGIGLAMGLARFLQSLLYGVRPMDPLAYAAVTLLLFLVALGACYVPARRATRVDPMVALRYE